MTTPRIARGGEGLWLLALVALVASTSCGTNSEGPLHPDDELYYPIGIAADPSEPYLYVVNSNFDLQYGSGALLVIDATTNSLIEGPIARIGNFGGEIELMTEGDEITGAFVAIRDDNSIEWVEIGRDEDGVPTLSCSSSPSKPCNADHVLDADGELGSNPFGIAVLPPRGELPATLLVSSIAGKALNVFDIGDTVTYRNELDLGFTGSHSMAVLPGTDYVYLTNKFYNVITSFNVAAYEDVETEEVTYEYDHKGYLSFSSGVDMSDFSRGITFSPTGSAAYVAYRSPNGVLVLDTTLSSSGEPMNRVADFIHMEAAPGMIATADLGDGTHLVLAAGYDDDSLEVVDPSLGAVIASVELESGPYDVATLSLPELGLTRAYVTCFSDHSIAVVELDPSSPNFLEVIAYVK